MSHQFGRWKIENKCWPSAYPIFSLRDGQLKRTKVKPELRQQKQEDFAQMLKVE